MICLCESSIFLLLPSVSKDNIKKTRENEKESVCLRGQQADNLSLTHTRRDEGNHNRWCLEFLDRTYARLPWQCVHGSILLVSAFYTIPFTDSSRRNPLQR